MSDITTHSRIEYLDFLRVFATIAVVCTHVSAINLDGPIFDSTEWHVHNLFGALFRWCVPIFLMISGALFLDKSKNISIKKLYKKNISRIIFAIAIWSIIYALYQYYTIEKYHNIYSIIGFSIIGHYHLWFLYMILSIYLALPILKLLALRIVYVRYFLIISFFFTFVIPIITNIIIVVIPQTASVFFNKHPYFTEALQSNLQHLTPQSMIGYTFYFILGHYLNTKKNKTGIIKTSLIGICGFATIAIPTSLLSRDHFCGDYYHYLSIGPLLEAYAVFLIGKCLWISNNKISIISLSNKSFGVYLIHPMIIETLLLYNFDTTSINPIFGIPFFTTIVFTISTFVVYILIKIPWVKRICL